MSLDLSIYKQNPATVGDANKLSNAYDAIQAFVNALPIANLAGFPADAAKYLRGDGVWAVVSAVHVAHNANQSVTSGVALRLAFNTERFDTDTMHDTVTNNNRITCKTAGKYQLTGHVEWEPNATGQRYLDIRRNGTDILVTDRRAAATGGAASDQGVTTLVDMAVNDYVELGAAQDSGGALLIEAFAFYSPEFMAVRVA